MNSQSSNRKSVVNWGSCARAIPLDGPSHVHVAAIAKTAETVPRPERHGDFIVSPSCFFSRLAGKRLGLPSFGSPAIKRRLTRSCVPASRRVCPHREGVFLLLRRDECRGGARQRSGRGGCHKFRKLRKGAAARHPTRRTRVMRSSGGKRYM